MSENNPELPSKHIYSLFYIKEKIDEDGWDPLWLLQHAPPDALDDKGIILSAVRKDGAALQYASENLRNEPEVVEAAIRESQLPGSDNFVFASDKLRSDPKFIVHMIHQGDWDIIEYMNDDLKNNEEILLAAARQHNEALTLIADTQLRDKIAKRLIEETRQ